MPDIGELLTKNREWAARKRQADPLCVSQVPKQVPEYLWIGCSECECPPSAVVGLPPDEVFAYYNMANQMMPTDISSASVLQYAVEVLQVKHIIVCGHDNCGIIQAAQGAGDGVLLNHWLLDLHMHLHGHQRARQEHGTHLDMPLNKLCELNVIRQVEHVVQSTCVQDAWRQHQSLHIHGWILCVTDGRIKDLGISQGIA